MGTRTGRAMGLGGVALAIASVGVSVAQAAPHGIYRTRSLNDFERVTSSVKPAPRAQQKLGYYGGPVIANVKTYAVFWGSAVDATTQSKIGGFYSSVTNSSYFDWLKEYDTSISAIGGRQGTNQTIGRGSHQGELTITPANSSKNLTDTDIQVELDHQIDTGALPKPDSDTLFMLYFPPGVTISIDGMASCLSFCAYHEGFVSKKFGNVFYGVMPDMGGACSLGCGFSAPFDTLTVVSSHELIEAVTDPFPTPADKPTYPQAWNTTDGQEIGDLCAGSDTRLTTQGVTYSLQQEFDNATGACAPGPYQSP